MIQIPNVGSGLAWTLLLSIGLSFSAAAQKNNVQSAANALGHKELDVAKGYIDKAAKHPITVNDYKMWWYRGEVYLAIHQDTSEFNYKALDRYAAEKAAYSFIKCIETDTKGWYEEDVKGKLFQSTFGVFDNAQAAYQLEEYEESIRMFMLILDVFPYDEENTLKRNNISKEVVYKNSYLAAQELEDWERGKQYLEKLIEMRYYDPSIYIGMSEIYLKEGDTTKALGYVEKGRALINDNLNLMIAEIDIYMGQNRIEELIKRITDDIAGDPEYELLYFNRATLYGEQGELDKALTDYLKAVELDPAFFLAHYRLGAMYYNLAIEIYNKMIALGMSASDQKKYDLYKVDYKKNFELAKPHLEEAINLRNKDWDTLVALKEVYARTGNYEKSREIAARIKALQN